MSTLVYSINLAAQLASAVFWFDQLAASKRSMKFKFLIWYLPFIVLHLIFKFSPYTVPDSLQSILCILTTIIPLSFYSTSIKRKAGMFTGYLLFQIITEAVSFVLTCKLFNITADDFYIYGDYSVYTSSARVLYADLILLFFIIMCTIVKRKQFMNGQKRFDLMNILSFSIVHLFTLGCYYYVNRDSLNELNNLIQTAFQALLFIMVFSHYKNAVKIKEYMEAEYELQSLKNEMDSTYRYYRLADEKFNEISSIRHDIRNQLSTVTDLIKSADNINEAENIIDEISKRIDSVRTINYCDNHTLNSVLSLKINDISLKKIETDIVICDTEFLPFNDYELCSVFSNLLDNAFEGCLRCSENRSRFISLRTGVKGNYYIIKVINSMPDDGFTRESCKSESGHGLGLKIIESICKKYNGKFILEAENGEVNSTIIVELSDKNNSLII